MSKGLAIFTVTLMLAAALLPLASAQDDPNHEFSPELGDTLSAFGHGYVENLMLYSGAGLHLRWGPSFDGNQTALDQRLGELESAAGDTMPPNTTPLVAPFHEGDPAFTGPTPLDHSERWMWNGSGIEARVDLGGLAATITAETEVASTLMDGAALDAKGLLLVLGALEAVRFMGHRLGFNGTDLGPINMSDPNMTDTNASNGWWLPVAQAKGTVNASNGDAWEEVMVEVEPTLEGSLGALRGLVALGHYLSTSDSLVGSGKPFPAGTETEVVAMANAVFNNLIALHYDGSLDMFLEDGDALSGDIALAYMAMADVSGTSIFVEYGRGWAQHRARRMADLLVMLQDENGTLQRGFSTNIGGIPEAYIHPYMMIPGAAGLVPHAMAVAALYDADDRFGGMAYASAARAYLASMDRNHWKDGDGIYVQEKMAETPSVLSGDQATAMNALTSAVRFGDVDLARYRIPQAWGGLVGAGLQLSETNATGEDYSIDGPDTNNNTIWKHNWTRPGKEHGFAPVLAARSTFDFGDENWTVDDDGMVNTHALMVAASVLMSMDADWFGAMGAPEYSEEYAHMLVHMSKDEILAWGEEWRLEAENLSTEVDQLQEEIANLTSEIDALEAEIASMEENGSQIMRELNSSRENESLLRNQTKWLREKLEETNETVDELEDRIEVLESQVSRLEKTNADLQENVTELKEELRSERNNVTLLRWELENATVAYEQALLDLDAVEKERDDLQDDHDRLQGRMLIIAVSCLIAGLVIALVALKLMRRL